MDTEYFHRWMDLLLARFEPGEQVLARGRAFEPRDVLRFDLSTVISGPGCAVAVTERGVLWVSRDDDRWVRSLPFALVRPMPRSRRRIGTRWPWTMRASTACSRLRRISCSGGLGQRRGGQLCHEHRAGV
jgi:hypothetical protein